MCAPCGVVRICSDQSNPTPLGIYIHIYPRRACFVSPSANQWGEAEWDRNVHHSRRQRRLPRNQQKQGKVLILCSSSLRLKARQSARGLLFSQKGQCEGGSSHPPDGSLLHTPLILHLGCRPQDLTKRTAEGEKQEKEQDESDRRGGNIAPGTVVIFFFFFAQTTEM